MPRVLIFVFAAVFLLRPAAGQNPAELFSKAPPEVEEALRARVSAFFQAQVEGKFRQAEQYVAEDSKDNYYEMNKTRYLNYEVRNINYSNNFTKAVVLVLVHAYVAIPGFEGKPVPVPLKTNWTLVDGQWYWHVDPAVKNMTPFGKMNPGPYPDPNAAQTGPTGASPAPTVKSVLSGIKVNKRIVQLKTSEASSDQIEISIGMPGVFKLTLNPIDVPGLQIKFDPAEMKNGEKAVAHFHYEPQGKTPPRSIQIFLIVNPIHYVIPIDVSFR
jgi:hypothetical protein